MRTRITLMRTRIDVDRIRRYPRTKQRSSAFRGQSAIEYAVLIAVVVLALVTMQIYIKRGISGKLRAAADSVGEPYHPKQTDADFTLSVISDTMTEAKLLKDQQVDDTTADVMVTTSTINDETTTRTGAETVGPLGNDLWN